jgi:hypothetical protein
MYENRIMKHFKTVKILNKVCLEIKKSMDRFQSQPIDNTFWNTEDEREEAEKGKS